MSADSKLKGTKINHNSAFKKINKITNSIFNQQSNEKIT